MLHHQSALASPGAATAVALTALAGAGWLLDPYQLTVATTALVAALVAVSAQLLTGAAGLPALGQAAPFGVGAYTAALAAQHWTTSAPILLTTAVFAAAAVAAVVGAALVTTRRLAFMLATLAVAELAQVAAETSRVTGGGNGLTTPPVQPLPSLDALTDPRSAYLFTLAVTVPAVLAVASLVRSRYGLVVRAIADHEDRTRANGHNVHRYLWTTCVVAAAVAGLAGFLHVTARRHISPADLGFETSALALLAAAIAGRSVLAAATAAAAIVVVRDLLGGLVPGHTPVLMGVLFLVAAFVIPPIWTVRRAGRPPP
jgi:branched-chain amino acid transport system permease protein